MKKTVKRALSIFLALMMIVSISPLINIAWAAPTDLQRQAVYTLADGNIGRSATVTNNRGGSNGGALTTINNGAINTNAVHNSWGTALGSTGNHYQIIFTWSQTYVVDAMRVMWDIYTDSGVDWPRSCTVEYFDGTNWILAGTPVNTIYNVGTAVGTVGVDGNSGGGANRPSLPQSTKRQNTKWNEVRFDPPIVTTRMRLNIISNKTATATAPGTGVQQWEVFGFSDPRFADLSWAAGQIGNLANLTEDKAAFPATGPSGSALSYVSSDPTVFGHDGKVTRPAEGQSDVTGTLTITAALDGQTESSVLNWEVLALWSPQRIVDTDYDWLTLSGLSDVRANLTLPLEGPSGSVISWSSSDTTHITNSGVVTRPVSQDAPVVLTATISDRGYTRNKTFNATVTSVLGADFAWLTVSGREPATANLTLPTSGQSGSTISWSSSNMAYVWNNGIVLRPPQGSADAAGVLTATLAYGGETMTKTFNFTVQAWPVGGKAIVGYDPINPVQARGLMLAKLPNYVKVYYSDGSSDMRQVMWQRYSAANQTSDFGQTSNYTITGNIMGDTSSSAGYQVVANITVTAAGAAAQAVYNDVPDKVPVATPLPWSSVVLDNDSTGVANRLVTNRTGSISFLLGQDVTAYCYNFRDTAGLTVSGYRAPGGWNARTEKLKGHGDGHYMTALALAYASGSTSAQKTQLLQRMERMTREARNAQSLTYVPFSESGLTEQVSAWTGNPHNGQLEYNSSNGWREAKDRYTTNAQVAALSTFNFQNTGDSHRFGGANAGVTYYNPATFGAGYMHSIIPESLVMNERYAGYAGAWSSTGTVWAPYYSVHKVLQGLIDIHDVLNGTVGTFDTQDAGPNRVATRTYQEVADEALMVAKEMGLWIYNRLEWRTRPGNYPSSGQTGYRNQMWGIYIQGESGGTIETLARLSLILAERGDFIPLSVEPKQQAVGQVASERLATAATYFDNNYSESASGNVPHNDALAQNRDSLRTLHANSHVPNAVGALWTYRATGDVRWYHIAENYLDYTIGRYAYSPGGVTGGPNDSNYERYPGAYQMTGGLVRSQARTDKIMETCATHNNTKLARDVYAHNPDDGQYMDYIERMLYSQLVGSIEAGTTNNSTTYGFHIGINSTTGTSYSGTPPAGTGTSVGGTCCTGTGSENHLRYQENAYYESADKNTLYANLYLPTTVTWAPHDTVIKQSCIWPSEESTFTFTPGVGATPFEIRFRVPSWATAAFDVKLNGVSLLTNGVEPNAYVSTGVRSWLATDTVVVTMPFGLGVHYSPTKRDGTDNWFGTLKWGPLLMAGTGISGTSYTATGQIVTLDTRMSTGAGTNVTPLSRSYLPTAAGRQQNNIPRLTVNVSGTNRTFSPLFWFLGNESRTTYVDIAISDSSVVDRNALYDKLMEAQFYLGGPFTTASLAVLQTAITAASLVYQNSSATATQISNQITALDNAISQLVGDGALDLAFLIAAIAVADPLDGDDYTWDTWGPVDVALTTAKAVLADGQLDPPTATQVQVFQAGYALNAAVAKLVPISSLNKEALGDALAEAALFENPPHVYNPAQVNDDGLVYYIDGAGVEQIDWIEHEYQNYTRLAWGRFLAAYAEAQKVFANDPKNYNQAEINAAATALSNAFGMQDAFLCDEWDEFDAWFAPIQAWFATLEPSDYDASYAALTLAIDSAINCRAQSTSAAWTWRDTSIREVNAAVAALKLLEFAVTFNGNGGNGTTMAPEVYVIHTSRALPENTYTRTNYRFTGWNTEPNGLGGTAYADKEVIGDLTANLDLYAQWVRTAVSPGPGPIIVPSW